MFNVKRISKNLFYFSCRISKKIIKSPISTPISSITIRKNFSTSIRKVSLIEQEISNVLSNVKEPLTNESLSNIGMIVSVKDSVMNEKDTNLTVNLTDGHIDISIKVVLDCCIPGYTETENLISLCKKELAKLSSARIHNMDFSLLKRTPRNFNFNESSMLCNIEHIIAISSCKGGVGKSTIAAHMANQLIDRGLRVGILDADIYGPSLPSILPHPNPVIEKSSNNPKHVLPIKYENGLKAISFGFVNSKAGVVGAV